MVATPRSILQIFLHIFAYFVFLVFGTCFGFLEVFWILGSVFGFWEVFWILGHVLDSGNCVALLEEQKSTHISATDH